MSRPESDRHLLLGILAFQNNFISREQLLAAFNAWVIEKNRSLGEILLAQAALSTQRHALIEALVEEHLRQHGGDAETSLAAVSSIKSVRQELQQITDPDVQASLAHVPAARIPDDARQLHTTVGLPTSANTRFMILRAHARGGLGEVHVARDQELNREVALKQIQEQHADDPHSRARFLLEAEITAGLQHPGIVPVYGLGTYASGRPFYAMRFIRGDSLQEAIDRFHSATRNPQSAFETLSFRKLLGRFLDVCNAMQYAHDRGVLHRDLKPGNVMLGKYGETLVVDWGLAKTLASRECERPELDEPALRPVSASGSDLTQMGAAIGTPAYMSPEQAAGRLDLLGPASDVYSLGATLYSLLTGQAPFDSEDQGELSRKVQQGDFPRPRQRQPNVPRALEAICLKAMAVKWDDRYGSPRALADDLERWLADQPVACHREPLSMRMGRFVRRHKPLVATAAAVLLTSTVGLAAGLFFINAEKNQTELARIAANKSADEARQREAETQAVFGFIEKRILAAVRPKDQEGGLGHDVKLADAIKSALPYVETSFRTQPLIEARLRLTLGTSFAYLGESQIAQEQEERARSLYKLHLGPDPLKTLVSMNNLAASYAASGRVAEALALREATLALMKARLGGDDPDTLSSMNQLAKSYFECGRQAQGLALREEVLALVEVKLGPDHHDTLASMDALAHSYYDDGRHAEALALYKKTLALRQAKLGPDHSDTLGSVNQLATRYAALGRADEALELREATLELVKAKLGPSHASTLSSMNQLADSYFEAGRQDQAFALREKILAAIKAKHGPDHVDTLSSMDTLANSYDEVGRHDR